jgi:stage II sporulation protein AA (anti-sigma F factor antagonist)
LYHDLPCVGADVEGVRTLSVSGEIDLSNCDALRRALGAESNHRTLIVSLLGVTYIDSTGISVLLAEHSRRRDRDEHFIVVLPPPPCLRVFEISRVTTILTCFTDLGEAVRQAQATSLH